MARVKRESGNPTVAVSEIADASQKLNAALESADKQTSTEAARAVVFDSANKPEFRPIDARFGPLVEKTLAPRDWTKIVDRFEGWLSLGERRTEEAFIRRAHEEGPEILMSLHDAHIQAKHAREAWEQMNGVLFGGMREQAERSLQEEKDRGKRSKTITEKDVELETCRMFPDAYARQEGLRRSHKAVEDRLKACIEVAQVRCRHLEGMMARLR